jgi:hypothetical protein
MTSRQLFLIITVCSILDTLFNLLEYLSHAPQ